MYLRELSYVPLEKVATFEPVRVRISLEMRRWTGIDVRPVWTGVEITMAASIVEGFLAQLAWELLVVGHGSILSSCQC